jgi:hypothetical protein
MKKTESKFCLVDTNVCMYRKTTISATPNLGRFTVKKISLIIY